MQQIRSIGTAKLCLPGLNWGDYWTWQACSSINGSIWLWWYPVSKGECHLLLQFKISNPQISRSPNRPFGNLIGYYNNCLSAKKVGKYIREPPHLRTFLKFRLVFRKLILFHWVTPQSDPSLIFDVVLYKKEQKSNAGKPVKKRAQPQNFIVFGKTSSSSSSPPHGTSIIPGSRSWWILPTCC